MNQLSAEEIELYQELMRSRLAERFAREAGFLETADALKHTVDQLISLVEERRRQRAVS